MNRAPLHIPESFPVTLIAAVGSNMGIGKNNSLLWNLPADMAHFRAATRGSAVVMGRKTWESLPEQFRPLPGRANIVATRRIGYRAQGAALAHSLEEALQTAKALSVPIFVIGGAELYAQAMPIASRIILTEIDQAPDADAFSRPSTPPSGRLNSASRRAPKPLSAPPHSASQLTSAPRLCPNALNQASAGPDANQPREP